MNGAGSRLALCTNGSPLERPHGPARAQVGATYYLTVRHLYERAAKHAEAVSGSACGVLDEVFQVYNMPANALAPSALEDSRLEKLVRRAGLECPGGTDGAPALDVRPSECLSHW